MVGSEILAFLTLLKVSANFRGFVKDPILEDKIFKSSSSSKSFLILFRLIISLR